MRPLRAVLVERATPRLVELLAAALDGTGPAILPLDAGLPPARLAGLIEALGPDSVEDERGVNQPRSVRNSGVAEGTAVVIGTSGSTGAPKGVELSAAALRHSARASLDRVGARPGERWLCCLPSRTWPASRSWCARWPAAPSRCWPTGPTPRRWPPSGCSHISLVPTQLQRLLESQGVVSIIDTAGRVLLGAAGRGRRPVPPAGRRPGRGVRW